MLNSLILLLATALSAGIRASVTGGPVRAEGPPTLELAIIGAVVVAAYAIATRIIWRRPANHRVRQVAESDHLGEVAAAAAESSQADEPKRGAA